MAARVAVYTLRIMGPNPEQYESSEEFDRRNQVVIDEIAPAISFAEEQISSLLPFGYYAKIEDA